MLKLESISKAYGTNSVLRDLFLEIKQGESVAVKGPSGCGKSTLLNLCGTLDSADNGNILFNGSSISNFKDKELAYHRNNNLGFVFQRHRLLEQCSLLENILLPTLTEKNRSEYIKRAETLLDKLGLSDKLDSFPSELSVGESQRGAIARALIKSPSLLLADEPTGSLDRNNSRQLAQMLTNLVKSEGLTLLTVTHSDLFATSMDRVVNLTNGKIDEK